MTFKPLIDWWCKFWFCQSSPASLCIFRIFVGALTFWTGVMLLPEAKDFFGVHAIVSQTVLHSQWGPRLGLLEFVSSDAQVYQVLALMLVSSLFLMIGLLTPLAAFGSFICAVSLVHRDPFISNSGDTLLRLAALFLTFSPSWRMYSVDALIFKHVMKRPWTEPVRGEIWVQRLLQLQLCLIYCMAFFSKLEGTTWLHGTAVYYAAHIDSLSRHQLYFLIDNPFVMRVLTWGARYQ